MGRRYIACINCKSKDHREIFKAKGNRGVDFISYQHHIVVCENCGLVFINPQHDEQDYDQFYEIFNYKKMLKYKEKVVVSKEKIIDMYTFKKIPLKFLVDYLKSSRTLESHPRVLDVGCGFGVFILFMQEYGLKAEGLDQSFDTVDFARKQLGLKVHAGSIFNHDLPEHHYDVITSTAVMEHLINPLRALKQMRRFLKRDGILFVNTLDLRGMVLRTGIDRWFKFVHTFYYTNVTLSSLIQLAGFEIIKTWQMCPILKYSSFLHPYNFYVGELNIIAKKKDLTANPLPLKEDVDEIFRVFKAAQKRDLPYSRLDAFFKMKPWGYSLRRIRRKFLRPPYVFRDYFEGTEVVDDYQTI
jgi:2-polyprenyl-3-methyl-5-hydroxy-6-metoxy-1,4-benzoquinol methylase